MGRASKDKRDMYYRKAKEEGYRARSAYKLLQIDEELDVFTNVTKAVDLCAAPGSWSQVLTAKLPQTPERRIVAVDLQEMAPIAGVVCIQGDITTEKTANEVIGRLGDVKAELVICDGAPDVTGLHELDEYVQHQLLLAALNITTFVLAPGGTFVTKMFRGPNTPFLVAKSEMFFENVMIMKPKSSRNASMEAFMVCQNFRPPIGFVASMVDPVCALDDYFPGDGASAATGAAGCSADETKANVIRSSSFAPLNDINRKVIRFLACGDLNGYDADMCYDRGDGPTLAPSHPPTQAPYLPVKESSSATEEQRKRLREEGEATA
uniref:Putative tRNA (cytidine(32)/guanosine(34)-2'-O)-methyltransferase n=1 Tax=Bodo saltans TaxID=75058 RepID=B6DTK1_BODSA|nr:ribosomal RNA methyltransferase [Bodo saltans]